MKASYLTAALLAFCLIGCSEQKETNKANNNQAQHGHGENLQSSNQPSVSVPKAQADYSTNSTPVSLLEFADLKKEAEKENAEAQERLGECYLNGWDGAEKDLDKAATCFEKAVKNGRTNAASTLVTIYSDSASPLYNAKKSFQYALRAAETGDAFAQGRLGIHYIEGLGVATNSVEGVRRLNVAIEALDKRAQQSDNETNEPWLRVGSKIDLAQLCERLADYYCEGLFVPKNVTNAIAWYEKASLAESGNAQLQLGYLHATETKNHNEAAKWFRMAAEKGMAYGQFNLGVSYQIGQGVVTDKAEAVKWYLKAAEQGVAPAQLNLGGMYKDGEGVIQDYVEAAKWFRKAAEQGDATAQQRLGVLYGNGNGVTQNYVEAYKWFNLAAAQGNEHGVTNRNKIIKWMTPDQIADAQRLSAAFVAREESANKRNSERIEELPGQRSDQPTSSGTGFLISDDGYLISNNHVVEGATQVRLVTSAGLLSAKVVKVDAANDLALLKAEGRFAPLAISASRGVKMGNTVATVGFPNIGLQGFAPKLAKGEIASLSGAADDARYFQISVPVQPGNSGGALVDERGNVVGVVSAKLNASAALKSSGALPENVNYAVKSSYLLSFLESVPEVAAKLKEVLADGPPKKFEDVVKEAEQAAVLVLVY